MAGDAAPTINFIDLVAQRRALGTRVDDAVKRVLEHGQFIMGPEVGRLESELGAFCGAKHVVSCANGTDALALVLMAKGVGPGDAVLCPSFTFAATAEVVAWLGATPVFVDVLRRHVQHGSRRASKPASPPRRRTGSNPVGVISGRSVRPAGRLRRDRAACAPSMACGCSAMPRRASAPRYKGRKVGTIGFATATSFFPAKPLGCYGDGGAIFTDDAELDARAALAARPRRRARTSTTTSASA